MHTVQPFDKKKYSTTATKAQVAEGLGDPALPYTERWRKALEDDRCIAVLQALFAHSACSPTFALTARCIARLTALHHQVVRRLIRGDRHCKARLQGLVAWLAGKGRRGTRYWLSPEGAKVAELLSKGLSLGEATLRALATDRLRRKMAHTAQMAHKNGTPSENNMPHGFNNYVCRQAVASKLGKPVGRDEPLSPLAEKLHRDFRIVAWVANDVVQRYSTEAIEAAIALCQRRNGRIVNGAGFIIYLLREGFAQAYVEARQRPEDEPDFAATAEALREALSPYGITVDDDGFAVFANARLALPPDPSEALARLREWGLLPSRPEALNEPDVEMSVSVSDQPDQDSKAELICRPALAAESEMDEPTSEPDLLPEPTCVVCQRQQSDHYPALVKAQPMMPLSRLSDGFRRRFNLPEEGYICRGCYLSLCKQLTSAETQGSDEDKSEATDLPVPAGTCPRCGASGELQPFEPQPFTQPFVAADPELERWNGKALCEACRCYLRVREGKVWLSNEAKRTAARAGGNLTTDVGFVDTEAWLAEWAFR